MHGLHTKIGVRTVLVLCISLVLISGCASLKTKVGKHSKKHRVFHQHQNHSEQFVVRTGGLLRSPHTIERMASETITLKQAILESGGILESQNLTLIPQSPATDTRPNNPQFAVESNSNGFDIQKFRQLFSQESEFDLLFEARTEFDGQSFTSPIFLEDSHDFLVKGILAIVELMPRQANEPPYSEIILQQQSTDQLVARYIELFERHRANNPSFADEAIAMFKSQISGQATARTKTPNLGTTSSIGIAAKQPEPILIGLTRAKNNGRTYYFHPQLVHQSAIGQMELENGDFVFAVLASETSLQQQMVYQYDFRIPVLGVSTEFNAVDYQNYRTLEQVYKLYEQVIAQKQLAAAGEDILILNRQGSTAKSDTFYIPIGTDNSGRHLAKPLVQNGEIQPGDSILFTFASRSPLAINRLLQKVSSQRSSNCKLAKHHSKSKNKTAMGKNLSKAATNIKYYTSPITRNVKSILR